MFRRSAAFYDAIYSFKDYAAEAAKVHDLVQRYSPGARTLLDVACGTGIHLMHLSSEYRAEGVDLSPELLGTARERNLNLPLHQADMREFDLGRQFDAVTCLFSSIGYMDSEENLRKAVANMARHLKPNGVLIVEPWLTPSDWQTGLLSTRFVDEPKLKMARINVSENPEGRISAIEFHYLVGIPESIEYFTERHELMLFTHDEYLDSFNASGLACDFDPVGLMGRGLYIGTRPRP